MDANAQHDDPGITTGEIRARLDRVLTENEITTAEADLRTAEPARWYTRLTCTVTAAAALDWVAVSVHTTLDHGANVSVIFGTHLAFFATLNVGALVLTAAWAAWNGRCRTGATRDDIRRKRHDLHMAEVRRNHDLQMTEVRRGVAAVLNQERQRYYKSVVDDLRAETHAAASGGETQVIPIGRPRAAVQRPT